MKQYCIIFLISFLGACGPEKVKNQDSPPRNRAERESAKDKRKADRQPAERQPEQSEQEEESGEASVEPNLPPALDNSPKLSGDETWLCKSESEEESYILNNNPSFIDDEGTVQARQRICELFRIYQGQTELVNLAHWTKDHCAKKLKEKIENRISQGWECSKN